MGSIVDLYVLYTIIRKISKPFKEWEAYKLGVIDDSGNFLIPYKERNNKQKDSLSYLDVFVLNIKKLLSKIPGANSKIATYAAALYLIRESHHTFNGDSFVSYITEEISGGEPTTPIPNNMSSGAIADPKLSTLGKQKLLKRYVKKKVDKTVP